MKFDFWYTCWNEPSTWIGHTIEYAIWFLVLIPALLYTLYGPILDPTESIWPFVGVAIVAGVFFLRTAKGFGETLIWAVLFAAAINFLIWGPML